MITGVFPIVTYNDIQKQWNCLGTGFFINPIGAFITAKHLFMDSDKKTERTLYGIQSVNGEQHLRLVTKVFPDENSDIMLGTLGMRVTESGSIAAEKCDFFAIDLEKINIGDEVKTYAYPNTQREIWHDELESFEFTFNGIFSNGKVVTYYPEGVSLLKNRC